MQDFDKLSREQKLKIFAMIVMSDGYIHKSQRSSSLRLTTSSKSLCQHDLFSRLSVELFGKSPKFYDERELVKSELFSLSAVREIMQFSPSFKTSPSRETAEHYLSSVQPTISFIFNESDEIKWLALNIWLDFDGSVSPSFRMKRKTDKKNGKEYVYYQVQFGCDIQICETNPNLVTEFVQLLKSLGMSATIKKDNRNWSCLQGVLITETNSIKRFLKYANPVTDVRISRKALYDGLTKKAVCKAVIDLLDSDNPKSLYFKNKEKAISCKNYLNSLLYRKIREYDSPLVQRSSTRGFGQ